jgi:hypothetical protein
MPLSLNKLEVLHKTISANDNLTFDAITIGGALNASEWFPTDSSEWNFALRALAGFDPLCGIDLIDRLNEHFAECQITCTRLIVDGHDDKEWRVHLLPQGHENMSQQAEATTLGRATILACLQLEIVKARKLAS